MYKKIEMEKLYSHPQKLLINHLREVASIAISIVTGEGFNFSLSEDLGLNRLQLTDLIWIAGAFHDLAKATSYFQAYIRDPEGIHSSLKNHAHLSSIFAYFIVRKYCQQRIK